MRTFSLKPVPFPRDRIQFVRSCTTLLRLPAFLVDGFNLSIEFFQAFAISSKGCKVLFVLSRGVQMQGIPCQLLVDTQTDMLYANESTRERIGWRPVHIALSLSQ